MNRIIALGLGGPLKILQSAPTDANIVTQGFGLAPNFIIAAGMGGSLSPSPITSLVTQGFGMAFASPPELIEGTLSDDDLARLRLRQQGGSSGKHSRTRVHVPGTAWARLIEINGNPTATLVLGQTTCARADLPIRVLIEHVGTHASDWEAVTVVAWRLRPNS